jgi:hypothetical protein
VDMTGKICQLVAARLEIPDDSVGPDTDLRSLPDSARSTRSRSFSISNRIWHIPARPARQRLLKISPDWPWKDAFLACWQRLCALPAPT